MPVPLSDGELVEEVARQIRALQRVDPDLKISHVKAHGALYNEAWRDAAVAKSIVAGVKAVFAAPSDVAVFAAPNSALAEAALAAGLRVVREGFVDRAYEKDGSLRSRKLAGGVCTPIRRSRRSRRSRSCAMAACARTTARS